MMGKLILGLAAGAMAAAALASQKSGEIPATIDWTIAPSGKPDKVQLGLSYRTRGGHSQNNRSVPLADLQGLDTARLASPGASDAAFRIARDAGRLDCTGSVRERRGAGTCRFAADPGFAAALEARGLGRPSERQLFQLTLQGAELAFLDALEQQGYARPSVEDFVAASIHGVSTDYLRGLDASGYRVGTVDKLVEMRIHGVSPAYIRELVAAVPRYRGVPADELIAMRIHGVTPERVRGYAAAGYADLAHDDLMAMAIHGVTPDYIRSLADAGYGGLSAKELVRMKIHGITAEAAARTSAALAETD